ncbi:hypothetical protein B0H17DRAFT_1040548 [Mycena rosella]|uniref:Abscisic acid G-protein coupled receptor-like domain-containing protein n=1 Tax=Mycena rosella TaxID=1033263 RepID=A0AAD7GS72_MYCRO|nr:hypothetical protein B0H17DRAFT_1040548 [Mycena rosella]
MRDRRHVGLVLVGVIILNSILRGLCGCVLRSTPSFFPAAWIPPSLSRAFPSAWLASSPPVGHGHVADVRHAGPPRDEPPPLRGAHAAARHAALSSSSLFPRSSLLLPLPLPPPTQRHHPQVIYLLSTIVQLRASFLPPPYHPSRYHPCPTHRETHRAHRAAQQEEKGEPQRGENLFATIPEFTVFGALFDWVFVLAAGGSLVVRWAAERVK